MSGIIEGNRKLGCGECGNESFDLFTPSKSAEFMDVLYVQCTKCKSYTVLKPEKPRFSIDWQEGNATLAIAPR